MLNVCGQAVLMSDVSVAWCRISVRFHPGAALLISHLLKSVGIAITWPGSTGAFPALPSELLRVHNIDVRLLRFLQSFIS